MQFRFVVEDVPSDVESTPSSAQPSVYTIQTRFRTLRCYTFSIIATCAALTIGTSVFVILWITSVLSEQAAIVYGVVLLLVAFACVVLSCCLGWTLRS